MENQTEGILMKSRSASACIKEGYRLYTGNFKKILKVSWHITLFYAIIFSTLCTISIIHLPRLSVQIFLNASHSEGTIGTHTAIIIFFIALIVIGGLLEIGSYSCVISILRQHLSTNTITLPAKRFFFDYRTAKRTLFAVLANIIIALPIIAISILCLLFPLRSAINAPGEHVTVLIFAALIFMAALLALLPIYFVTIKYIFLEETSFWQLLASNYSVGMRHFGFIFIILLVSAIIVGIAEYILTNPAFILSVANYQANIGVLYNDPLGMPEYITYISALVFFIAGFIQIYIRMSVLFTAYYMYGSIEMQENELGNLKDTKRLSDIIQSEKQ